METKDTNVKLVKKLRDGMEVYSAVNSAGAPFVITKFPDGREEGSLMITNGYTIAEKAAEAVVIHYKHNRRSIESFEDVMDAEGYIDGMIADLEDMLIMTSRRRIDKKCLTAADSEG